MFMNWSHLNRSDAGHMSESPSHLFLPPSGIYNPNMFDLTLPRLSATKQTKGGGKKKSSMNMEIQYFSPPPTPRCPPLTPLHILTPASGRDYLAVKPPSPPFPSHSDLDVVSLCAERLNTPKQRRQWLMPPLSGNVNDTLRAEPPPPGAILQ